MQILLLLTISTFFIVSSLVYPTQLQKRLDICFYFLVDFLWFLNIFYVISLTHLSFILAYIYTVRKAINFWNPTNGIFYIVRLQIFEIYDLAYHFSSIQITNHLCILNMVNSLRCLEINLCIFTNLPLLFESGMFKTGHNF